jgi:hypothetical protein
MIENVLRHLGGIENYGILSLLLFFGFFIGMLIWAFGLRKPFLQSMSRLPLENGSDPQDQGIQSHD